MAPVRMDPRIMRKCLHSPILGPKFHQNGSNDPEQSLSYVQIVENLDLYNFVRSNNSRYVDMYLPLAYTFAISYRNTFYINLLTLTFKNMILLFVNVKRCFFFNVSEFRPDIKKKKVKTWSLEMLEYSTLQETSQ